MDPFVLVHWQGLHRFHPDHHRLQQLVLLFSLLSLVFLRRLSFRVFLSLRLLSLNSLVEAEFEEFDVDEQVQRISSLNKEAEYFKDE